jgi:hypothetical protein
MRAPIRVLLLSFFAACSSTGPFSGVRLTRDPAEIAGCRLLGSVTSREGNRDLKRRARELGGDVVYLVSESVSVGRDSGEASGMVYLCATRAKEK